MTQTTPSLSLLLPSTPRKVSERATTQPQHAACSLHSRKLLQRSPNCRPLLVLHANIVVGAAVGDPPTSHPRYHMWNCRTTSGLSASGERRGSLTTDSPGAGIRDKIRLPRFRTPMPHNMPMVDVRVPGCWFSTDDLLSVPVNLANKARIEITGAVVLRLRASYSANDRQSCATMVYVSPAAHGFYLSREAMVDLGIVPVDLPSISPLPPIPASAPSTDGPPGPRNQQDCGLRASNSCCVSALAENDGP